MIRAAQFNLTLPGESFALVGERVQVQTCGDCGRSDVLIAGGFCESCHNAHAQALIEAEARQGAFFMEEPDL